ncbi:hypothetical protein GCM10007063_22040 [Lentibacillus kapialis]|uniref:Sodium-dependent dicarboxylate transporter SdcS n=1 Tax=Lentibacillus kapialis TaxID=340214 RepID=A0A917UZ47_9BACI|nr:SLC13 family permease [Lentibacillus kapialis]GGJ99341.1 hypothetical protein GCM10007063_22040 [Lentibacillus kapialis]
MRKQTILMALVMMLYGIFFMPVFDANLQEKALGALLIIQILWIGRVFPLAFSSLILILILSVHFFTFDETLAFFGSELVWLLFSTFILSHAFIQTGLANRISLYILSLAKGSGNLLIFVSFIMMFVLTVFIPSNVGKGSLVTSIFDDLVKNLKRVQSTSSLEKSLFIGVTYVGAISAAFVPTGASSTIYAFGMFSTVSSDMTYFNWMLLFSVPIFLFLLVLWFVFYHVFPEEKVNHQRFKTLIEDKIHGLGHWQKKEIKMAMIITVTLSLWLTQPLHGFSIPLVGLIGAVLTIFPYVGVFDWNEAKKGVNWDMMIFFAATLMLSNMLIDTGTLDVVSEFLITHVNEFNVSFFVIGIVIMTAVIRVFFVNVLGYLTIMLPLALTLGEQLSGFSSLIIAMGVYLAGVPGFLLVTQSPVHLISFSYGYFTNRDLIRTGSIAMMAWVAIILLSIFFYWRYMI